MKNQVLLAAAISAALSVSAFAANQGPAQSGLYIGGNLGAASLDITKLQSSKVLFPKKYPNLQSLDMTNNFNFAWGVFGGYQYAIMNNVSVGAELGYNDNGYAKSKEHLVEINYNSTDIDLLGTASYYFSRQLSVIAKAGVARVTQELSSHHIDFASENMIGYAPEVVLGLGFSPIQNINLTLEFDHIFGEDTSKIIKLDGSSDLLQPEGVASVNAVKAGVTYRLPM